MVTRTIYIYIIGYQWFWVVCHHEQVHPPVIMAVENNRFQLVNYLQLVDVPGSYVRSSEAMNNQEVPLSTTISHP